MYLEKEALDYFRKFDMTDSFLLPLLSNQYGDIFSRKPGRNMEFEQYREYSAGDNLKDIDWKVYARSSHPGVNLTPEGDRVFVGGPRDTAQHIFRIRLTERDLDYIEGFDCCHTSCFSGIEPELANLASRCHLSFDFSTHYADDYLRSVCPHLRFAFFSGASLTEDHLDSIIEFCHDCGVEVVGITLGARGAVFSRRGERFIQPAKPAVSVVDTMGAGDSFIAGFLTRFYEFGDMRTALDYAADCAANTCSFFGAFGHPHPLDD
jgi:fructoselysine 6-kinase